MDRSEELIRHFERLLDGLRNRNAAAEEEAERLLAASAALATIIDGAPTEKPEDLGYIGNEDDAENEGWKKARYWAASVARAARGEG